MKKSYPLFLIVTFSALLAGCASDSGWAPSPDEPRAFISTLGSDTMAVEVYVRSGDVIEGTLVERSPQTRMTEYRVELNETGHFRSLSWSTMTPSTNPGGASPTAGSITIDGDSATVVREGGQNPGMSKVAAPGNVILSLGRTGASMFVFEQVATQRLGGADEILIMGTNGSAARANAVQTISTDSISMDYFGNQRVGWVDDQGQLIGISGALTTNKMNSKRVEPFLVGSIADRWAALDLAGQGIGTPSPAATAVAQVDGANIEIQYSQPAKRGRDIWGGLVPNGTVWRTGANAATHLTTSQDLMFGEDTLPAGMYTLWSLWEDGAYSIILNEQTNQWGTAYDGSMDLFRVSATAVALSSVVERFTLSVEDTDSGGDLVLSWDMTQYRVPFTVQ
ncbi:MAG: DUF2911 domain-containing protein [Bacteroidetes bacterium]|nr:DUF2911 domain-containing protein [Bacteroidota bacterium]MDA1333160.1 DUF2911 domain-containing protein [Bacteroidota bacterium]